MMQDIGGNEIIKMSKEVEAGQAPYSKKYIMMNYDLNVVFINNKFYWKCPTSIILDLYNKNVTSNHLDIGVGTGYYLDKCRFPWDNVRLGLMDLNLNSLAWAEKRLKRFDPEKYRCNILDPINKKIKSFDSISLGFVICCLPGKLADKAVIFDNIDPILSKGGTVFGATVLYSGVEKSRKAENLMIKYNKIGVFYNLQDDLKTLEDILSKKYKTYNITVKGCTALFWAKK